MASLMSDRVRAQLCALLDHPDAGAVTEDVIHYAREHGLHLVLANRCPVPALSSELRGAVAVEAAREVELRRVLDILAASGLRPILIKGAAVARTHYRRPESRPRLDADLMIPELGRARALAVLAGLGYAQPAETAGELCVSQFHCQRTDEHGITHALDVHWRISNVLAFADVLSYDELAGAAVRLPTLGPSAFAPCAAHSLVIACTHRIAHHRDTSRLLWLYDIHLLSASLSIEDRDLVAAIAERRQIRRVCAISLRRAHDAFGGSAGALAARLEPPPGTVEATAVLFDTPMRTIDVFAADIRTIGGWRERARLAREHLFPPPAYMFARYGTRRSLWLPWLYCRRIVAGAPKWFRP